MFLAYHELLADEGLSGDVLEIGVHHGLSAIGAAALRGDARAFVAVDLFDDLQTENVSGSGLGNREAFLSNMRRFHDDLSFLRVITGPSAALRAEELGNGFSFCHIDGGHSDAEAYADLELCAAISKPGGLVAVDDYFNPAFPGVGEAAVRFHLDRPGVLRPIAIGFNKALFQREPAPFDLNVRFGEVFPTVLSSTAALWGEPARWFDAAFGAFFDVACSTPRRLTLAAGPSVSAAIEPSQQLVTATAGDNIPVSVQVTNLSRFPMAMGVRPFALAYHLLTADHQLLGYDNARQWFTEPLLPGATRNVIVPVQVPMAPGSYALEFDVVWEGVTWLRAQGNAAPRIALDAVPRDTATPALAIRETS
jgi:hypothetical protein